MTRVLGAEDEESFSDALSYQLRRQGFDVASCSTGPDRGGLAWTRKSSGKSEAQAAAAASPR